MDDQKPAVTAVLINYEEPWNSVTMDSIGQDNFLIQNGVLFDHYKAVPCVLGQTVEGDIRHSHNHDFEGNTNVHCENGFLYCFAGQVWGVFTNKSKQMAYIPAGFYGSSSAMLTFNRYYRGTTKIASFTEYDKLIPCECPKEFFHSNFEKVTHSMTGVDRTQFQITEIEYVTDSDGKFYNEGIDFKIDSQGHIAWIPGGKQPGWNNVADKPKLISVRYKYKPYFYVKQMMHEIRIFPQMNAYDGSYSMQKMPMQAQVQADYIFLNNRTEQDVPDAEINAPTGNNVGPR